MSAATIQRTEVFM